jgi:hypothetical protein
VKLNCEHPHHATLDTVLKMNKCPETNIRVGSENKKGYEGGELCDGGGCLMMRRSRKRKLGERRKGLCLAALGMADS